MIANFNILIEKGEEGYLISEVVEFLRCPTQTKNIDELLKRTKEAISLYLEVEGKNFNDTFISFQKIEV